MKRKYNFPIVALLLLILVAAPVGANPSDSEEMLQRSALHFFSEGDVVDSSSQQLISREVTGSAVFEFDEKGSAFIEVTYNKSNLQLTVKSRETPIFKSIVEYEDGAQSITINIADSASGIFATIGRGYDGQYFACYDAVIGNAHYSVWDTSFENKGDFASIIDGNSFFESYEYQNETNHHESTSVSFESPQLGASRESGGMMLLETGSSGIYFVEHWSLGVTESAEEPALVTQMVQDYSEVDTTLWRKHPYISQIQADLALACKQDESEEIFNRLAGYLVNMHGGQDNGVTRWYTRTGMAGEAIIYAYHYENIWNETCYPEDAIVTACCCQSLDETDMAEAFGTGTTFGASVYVGFINNGSSTGERRLWDNLARSDMTIDEAIQFAWNRNEEVYPLHSLQYYPESSSAGQTKLANPSGAQYPTFPDGWNYRRTHSIIGSSEAGNNYTVQLRIYRMGLSAPETNEIELGYTDETGYDEIPCQFDFDDIRFTLSDGITELKYWREDNNLRYDSGNLGYATFWVKISDASVNQDIYIYYGDYSAKAADTTSNGDDTFLFFDDFSDTSIDSQKWSTHGDCSEADGYLTVTTPNGNQQHATVTSLSTWDMTEKSLESKFQFDQWGSREWGMTVTHSTSNGASIRAMLISTTNDLSSDNYLNIDGGPYEDYENWFAWDDDEFQRCQMSFTPQGSIKNYWQIDSTNHSWNNGEFPSTNMYILLGFHLAEYTGSQSGTTEMDYDWVFLRNKVADEPSHGSWGSEEVSLKSQGWQYRKSHEMEKSTGAGVGYQVNVQVHLGDNQGEEDSEDDVYIFDQDCGSFNEIRFADAGGFSIPYWLESIEVEDQYNDVASFWVQIPGDLGESDQLFYIYYGKSGVASASDGDATFIWFDDFENDNLNKWSNAGSAWDTTSNVGGRNSIVAYGNAQSSGRQLQEDIADIDYGVMIMSQVFQTVGTRVTFQQYHVSSDPDTASVYSVALDTDDELKYYNGTAYYTWGSTFSINTWFHVGVGYDFSNHNMYLWNNGTAASNNPCPLANSVGNGVNDITEIRALVDSLNNDMYLDDYIIRKWIVSEPSHGSWGTQESL